ncbi:uncharacterized protein LOC143430851 [Xylocopa sonorina]|uniref:uncharacterized protein LOC143430851 n=1 Tax=Xylocopa sonorina TaxID=1818115 RepID=UPI00403AD399
MVQGLCGGMIELVVATEPYRILRRPSVVIAYRFDILLNELQNIVSLHADHPVFVLGVFNAHTSACYSPRTNQRDHSVLDWAAGLGLWLLNRGSASTCMRYQGESIVHLSFANVLTARRVSGWMVDDVETLSDHVYIRMDVSTFLPTRPSTHHQRRWSLKGMDEDALMAAVLAVA